MGNFDRFAIWLLFVSLILAGESSTKRQTLNWAKHSFSHFPFLSFVKSCAPLRER